MICFMPIVEIVAVDDRAAVGLLRQRAQRVHRRRRDWPCRRCWPTPSLMSNSNAGEPARIDRVDRARCCGSPCRRRRADRQQVDVREEPRAVLVRCRSRRPSDCRRFGLPMPGHRRDGIAHLRRQGVRVALADQDQRLAPFLNEPMPGDERLERRQADLVADPLDGLGRIVRVLLLDLVARLVVVLAAVEPLDRANDRCVVARERDVLERRSADTSTPTMSRSPSSFRMNRVSGSRTDMLAPRRT